MSEQSGEKSFAPSQKRLRDAAKNGDVVRSRELATAVVVLAGVAWLWFADDWMMASFSEVFHLGLRWDRAALDNFEPGAVLRAMLGATLPMILALGAITIVVSLASQLAFGHGRFNAGNMAPKFSRLNPLSGLKRMFGPNGLIELGKALVKVALLGAIAWWFAQGVIGSVLGLGRGNLIGQLDYAWDLLIRLMLTLSAGLVVIALFDVPIQIVRQLGRLKMTHQEMRDEHKESEGSPEKKAAIRQRQREIAKGGMHRAMRDAQFVITNPTHFSVALTYDPTRASAPIVLAKGRGEKALAMRELAKELNVPVLEYPMLARSVYFTTRENMVIREELFIAVASVLAFVMSLKRGERPARPVIDVPMHMRFDEFGRAAEQ
ncbi:EscU/YscU/HrcU family type III secretion system export apparatus switch protein [Sphingomonas colocasiae]|uniref:EscU/YscU/HrcU family type III secretion system export apparatus switch protein n=1 Tax=Sphingomonas colocasiae TaxID=1848973 RepID=A0ABS7PT92_9SPHN|nr:flagellar type III secretion system protein FlhB [Sphingomonas colocasiae]MBY8824433.1 EscU/YscU/HrcU family type III secretion system export apparatus switch protein [Sphingomonas colocasiae]